MDSLLIYSPKNTPRLTYVFKHICTRLLGMPIAFTTEIPVFVAHGGPKIWYGPSGQGNNTFYIKSRELLFQQGITDIEIRVRPWEQTVGFFATSPDSSLPFDIFAASFYLLSRYEEYLPHVKDAMGRYPAAESLAATSNFLNQAVVDIWAHKFLEALRETYPEIKYQLPEFEIQNLIDVPQAFEYKSKGFLRSFFGYFSDLFRFRFRAIAHRTRVLLLLSKDPHNTFDWLAEVGKEHQVNYRCFFQVGDYSRDDYNISHHKKAYRRLIKSAADYAPVGLRISHRALTDLKQLKEEKRRLEAITNRPVACSINASGVLNIPDILRALVDLEVDENYSMGYSDTPGFRAGTSRPFYFYDLDFEVQTPLRLVPYSIAQTALENLTTEEIETLVKEYKSGLMNVGGSLVMLMRNDTFALSFDNRFWRTLYTQHLTHE
ncbi:polysaccharide deacetylase family protein [Gilvibacter sp.]|uniref:polysaccharide deacetylase family protein n=1 Tax=Gilvibacter sp. TaxID=2729997 RepID=UPI0025BFE6B8|nr:polysaccharide deacetylase family protein [Gilvibacter sp.]NQX76777.1 hypothetical protein [Gilvibacter sp.]